jgi:hypothetical protein
MLNVRVSCGKHMLDKRITMFIIFLYKFRFSIGLAHDT